MALNPVELKLLELRDLWDQFVSRPEKRLLIWRCSASAYRLIDCFLEAQKFETDYSTQDVFLTFKTSFLSSSQYTQDIKAAFSQSHIESKDAIAEEGLAADWHFRPEQWPHSPTGLVQSFCSFGGHYGAHIKHLACVLMPSQVARKAQFVDMVRHLLAVPMPERLRFLVLDPAEAPLLDDLSEEALPIMRQMPDLDIMAVAQETFSQEAAPGPAGVFRNHLVALVSLVEKGTPAEVDAKAQDALRFAERQGWLDQQIAVLLLLAGARQKDQRNDEAIELYQMAGLAGGRAAEEGHPAGRKLQMQAGFGEAGAQLAAARLPEAAACYDRIAGIARAENEPALFIEAARMGAFCHDRMGDPAAAITRIWSAFEAGEQVADGMRGFTTLPIAANDLLRILDPVPSENVNQLYAQSQASTEEEIQRLDGEAVRLEHAPDEFQSAQRLAEVRCTAVWEMAEVKLQAIVSAAQPGFQEGFRRARALLGPAWPFADAAEYGPPVETTAIAGVNA